jgi:hypothetical protein
MREIIRTLDDGKELDIRVDKDDGDSKNTFLIQGSDIIEIHPDQRQGIIETLGGTFNPSWVFVTEPPDPSNTGFVTPAHLEERLDRHNEVLKERNLDLVNRLLDEANRQGKFEDHPHHFAVSESLGFVAENILEALGIDVMECLAERK